MDFQKEKDFQESKSSRPVEKTGLFGSLFKKKEKSSGKDGIKENGSIIKESIFKNFSFSPENNDMEISLMPEKAIIIPRIIHSRNLLLIAAFIIVINIFTISWLYLDWHFEKIGNEVDRIEREMQSIEAQSMSFLSARDEIIALEDNASRTENILNDHIYWTKFFSLLEKYTTADVFFGDFSADTSGIIRLDSLCRDLISVARQFVVFSQAPDFVKEVDVSDVVNAPTGIKATFNLVLVDDVFKK